MIRQPIKIYQKQNVQDDAGGFTSSNVLVLSTMALVKQFSSTYDNEAKQAVMQDGIKCEMWKRLDFAPTIHHFVEWRGAKYQIISVMIGIAPDNKYTFTATRIKE